MNEYFKAAKLVNEVSAKISKDPNARHYIPASTLCDYAKREGYSDKDISMIRAFLEKGEKNK